MRPNQVKRKLAAGGTVYGVFVSQNSPALAELFGYTGFDYVLIDAEHGALDPGDVEDITRGVEAAGVTPWSASPPTIRESSSAIWMPDRRALWSPGANPPPRRRPRCRRRNTIPKATAVWPGCGRRVSA